MSSTSMAVEFLTPKTGSTSTGIVVLITIYTDFERKYALPRDIRDFCRYPEETRCYLNDALIFLDVEDHAQDVDEEEVAVAVAGDVDGEE